MRLALVLTAFLSASCGASPDKARDDQPRPQFWERLPVVEESSEGTLRVATGIDLSEYSMVLLEPTSWRTDPTRQAVQPTPQHLRVLDEIWCALRDELSTKRKLVSRPAPGVLQVRVTLVERRGDRGWILAVSSREPNVEGLSMGALDMSLAKELRGGHIRGEIRDARSKRLFSTFVSQPTPESPGDWEEVRQRCRAWVSRFLAPLDTRSPDSE